MVTSQRLLKSALALVAGLALVACGGTDPKETESGETGPLLPMAEGNVWEYQVTDAGGMISQKRTTVFAMEPVGGSGPNAAVSAFKVVTRKGSDLNVEVGLDKTESWQGPQAGAPERLVRYRELSYGAMTQLLQLDEYWDPPRIHVDSTAEHTKTGEHWLEPPYKETKIPADGTAPTTSTENDYWLVLSGNETVKVPAGTFENTVHLRKRSDSGSEKEYWFARNVGKVKETGSQTEELTKCTLCPGATP